MGSHRMPLWIGRTLLMRKTSLGYGVDKPWHLDAAAWTAAIACLGYPLVGLTAAYLSIPDNSLAFGLRLFVVLLATMVFGVNAARYGVKLPHVGLILFLMLYTSRLVWDTGRASQPNADSALVAYTSLILIPLIALVAPTAPWRISNVITCFFWIGSICCIAALALSELGFNVDPEESGGRLEFERLNPITLGHTGSLSLLSVLVGWSYWRSRWKFASLLTVPSSALVLFLSASRGPLAAFIVTTLIYCALKRYWSLLLFLVLVIFLVIASSPMVGDESLFARLRLATELQRDETTTVRLAYGQIAWQEFLENPLFGSGFELPVIGGYPHNIILEAGMAMGVVGLALLLALITVTLSKAVFGIATGRGDSFAAALFIYDLVASQFSGSLWGQTLLFLMMGRILSYPLLNPGVAPARFTGGSPAPPPHRA